MIAAAVTGATIGAGVTAFITRWAIPAAALASLMAALGTLYLARQTARLARETREATRDQRRQTDLIDRDRELRLRPVLQIHHWDVVDESQRAVLWVSNYGQGLAASAFCVGRHSDEHDRSYSFVSSRPIHIPPGGQRIGLELRHVPEQHDALLKPASDEPRISLQYSVFCVDEIAHRLYRFLYPYGVDTWTPGEPRPPWVDPLLDLAPYLSPGAGAGWRA